MCGAIESHVVHTAHTRTRAPVKSKNGDTLFGQSNITSIMSGLCIIRFFLDGFRDNFGETFVLSVPLFRERAAEGLDTLLDALYLYCRTALSASRPFVYLCCCSAALIFFYWTLQRKLVSFFLVWPVGIELLRFCLPSATQQPSIPLKVRRCSLAFAAAVTSFFVLLGAEPRKKNANFWEALL